MPYGSLTREMERVVANFVWNRAVWDLGAGDLTHTRALLGMGASQVVAIDRTPMNLGVFSREPPELVVRTEYFEATARRQERPDVAFLAWPVNWKSPGLLEIIETSPVVIYLGCNTGGSSCGTPDLFRALARRTVLAEVRHPQNDLIVYGGEGSPRDLRPEERAALSDDVVPWTPT
jgi:hypothetical protein